MKGPRMNFAIVQFMPGQDFTAHYHNVMEENFFILEGKIDIVVDGKVNTLSAGDLIHIEPSEVHYCINNYDVPVKMISTLAPYQEVLPARRAYDLLNDRQIDLQTSLPLKGKGVLILEFGKVN